MYNNPFMNTYNPQVSIDKLNEQINNLEKMKAQIQQPPSINQTFQLAPNRDVIRFASSLEEVQRDMVIGDTPYFSKDMSVVWIKNIKGDIKTYELNEIIPKDERDMQIELLQAQINELKEGIKNEQFNKNAISTKDTTNTTKYDDEDGTTIESTKPTSVSRISTSKKGK